MDNKKNTQESVFYCQSYFNSFFASSESSATFFRFWFRSFVQNFFSSLSAASSIYNDSIRHSDFCSCVSWLRILKVLFSI